jgi:predicted SnoaL-like aldol condensation-catalyzing enzyme
MSRKETALLFLQRAAFGSVEEAFRMVTPGFRHHNPHFAAGADALKVAMAESAIKNADKRLDVQRSLEDGDLVVIHSRIVLQREQPGHSVVHIFRFEGDKIAEMWDIGQDVPAESPNSDGMF